jgi:hypothetical protein
MHSVPTDPSTPPVGPQASDVQAAKYLADVYHQLQHELSKVIVGRSG